MKIKSWVLSLFGCCLCLGAAKAAWSQAAWQTGGSSQSSASSVAQSDSGNSNTSLEDYSRKFAARRRRDEAEKASKTPYAGWYMGANLGIDSPWINGITDPAGNTMSATPNAAQPAAASLGLRVGRLWESSGHWVFGGYAYLQKNSQTTLSYANYANGDTGPIAGCSGFYCYHFSSVQGGAAIQAGYNKNQFLFYALLGLGAVSTSQITLNSPYGTTTEPGMSGSGPIIGGGVEYMLQNRLGLYMEVDDQISSLSGYTNAQGQTGTLTNLNLLFGLNYHFR